MKAKIKNKKEIAKETLFVEFDLSGKEINFKPGQYFFIALLNPLHTDEKGNHRYFSIINLPSQKGVLAMATRITGSAFKKSLAEMPVGAEVEIGAVAGNFVLPEDKSKPLVFVAGGIGITPFISMIKNIKEENLDYKITLIYSNRNRETAAFLDELRSMAEEIQNFKLILTMTDDEGWDGEKRFVDAKFIKDYILEPDSNAYMIAGPPKMAEMMRGVLAEAGVSEENIKLENFIGY